MIGLLIGLGIGFLLSVISFSLLNYQLYYKFNPFYNFVDNVKYGGWLIMLLLLVALPIIGYVSDVNHDCLEKCNVNWSFDEETGNVKIDVTGSKVKDAVINLNLKQN